MKNKTEELKPCPLCGCEAHDDGGGSCMSPSCPMSAIVLKIPTIDQWNNAYCWKKLEEACSLLEEVQRKIYKINGCYNLEYKIQKFLKENKPKQEGK